ncbi:MAG: 2Fe-2S iron-sulfur cluster binding domain-containing protein [Gammaproteobacteria bacterium]|nr:2Fe-2S iron-sulfur cluster binding domain-containing protein [Gammaproteobacteria bacterium]
MLSFHALTLTRREPVAEDAVSLDLLPEAGLREAFRFEPGQHLPVRAMIDGRELRRTYSIVGTAGDALRVAVRVQGEMSRYLAETLAIGDRLDAMEPTGRFRPTLDAARARSVVAFASGSGITPVLPILEAILRVEPASNAMLFYGNRTAARAMFVDELLALKNRYLDRFAVHFLMSREPQDVALFNGRLDGAKLRELAASEFDPQATDECFVCGPGAMVKELAATLRELGVAGKVHVERFSTDSLAAPGRAVPAAVPAAAPSVAQTEVQVTIDGRRRAFQMSREEPILDAAERAGLSLPFSCRSGVCSTCRAKLVAGTVEMERNQALEDWEVQAGFILCCQARPTSARVEISYDEK